MNIMTRAVFSQNPVFNFMNSLRRCIVSRRFTLHSRISRRFYSEETKESQAESSTALRTIVWLAGMGGFFGAAIYFIGSPDKEEDKNVSFGEFCGLLCSDAYMLCAFFIHSCIHSFILAFIHSFLHSLLVEYIWIPC